MEKGVTIHMGDTEVHLVTPHGQELTVWAIDRNQLTGDYVPERVSITPTKRDDRFTIIGQWSGHISFYIGKRGGHGKAFDQTTEGRRA